MAGDGAGLTPTVRRAFIEVASAVSGVLLSSLRWHRKICVSEGL